MASPVLKTESLRKSYHDGERELEILAGVDIEVGAGETLAILGRSGSGKSTFLNLVGLLDRPSGGEILLGGRPTSDFSESERTKARGRAVGFVFQNYHLLGEFTALENVMLGAAIGGGGFGRANRLRAQEWLARMRLGELARRYPHRLSGGERQRAAIARALMSGPSLLLCDEPTGNLDASTGEEIMDLLWKGAASSGMAMIVVTHDLGIARRAGRALCLENGLFRPFGE